MYIGTFYNTPSVIIHNARIQINEKYHWHPHQLRHNAATFLRKEFGLETARIILGHRSAAITEVYAELDQQKAMEAIVRVGQYLLLIAIGKLYISLGEFKPHTRSECFSRIKCAAPVGTTTTIAKDSCAYHDNKSDRSNKNR